MGFVKGIDINVMSVTLFLVFIISGATLSKESKPERNSDSVYINDSENALNNASATITVIPITDISVNYHNSTDVDYEKQFADSFFIESANDLIHYECTKYFSLADNGETPTKDPLDSLGILGGLKCSRLNKDSVDFETFSNNMKSVAIKYGTDLILVPYSCSINHIISQQKGWRGLSSTAGPVKYSARARVHVQIWTKDGTLLYEKIGTANTGRPRLYTVFRKRKMDRGIVSYAKNLFSSPLVKSLFKAIEKALDIQGHTDG
jgi:hypothetical protein